jgi:hypothetical protein
MAIVEYGISMRPWRPVTLEEKSITSGPHCCGMKELVDQVYCIYFYFLLRVHPKRRNSKVKNSYPVILDL